MVSITNQSSGQAWSNETSTLIGSTAQSTYNGLTNSNAIIGQSGFTNGAAKTCLDYSVGSIDDWYLPAIDELSLLWQNRFNVSRTLSGASSAGTIPGTPTQIGFNNYWSSTEYDSGYSWGFNFLNGAADEYSKTFLFYVRAIRKFSI